MFELVACHYVRPAGFSFFSHCVICCTSETTERTARQFGGLRLLCELPGHYTLSLQSCVQSSVCVYQCQKLTLLRIDFQGRFCIYKGIFVFKQDQMDNDNDHYGC